MRIRLVPEENGRCVSTRKSSPAAAASQDSQVANDEPPLTQGERDVDRVIGILLGEPQEVAQKPEEQTHRR